MKQPTSSISLKGLLKTLSILYFIFLGSQVLFALGAFIQQKTTYFEFENSEDALIYAVPILAIVGFVSSVVIYREQISALTHGDTIKKKLLTYQNAYLIRMAFLEAASLFGIIAFFLKGNLFSLMFSGLLIIYFLTIRPAKRKVEADLDLV